MRSLDSSSDADKPARYFEIERQRAKVVQVALVLYTVSASFDAIRLAVCLTRSSHVSSDNTTGRKCPPRYTLNVAGNSQRDRLIRWVPLHLTSREAYPPGQAHQRQEEHLDRRSHPFSHSLSREHPRIYWGDALVPQPPRYIPCWNLPLLSSRPLSSANSTGKSPAHKGCLFVE